MNGKVLGTCMRLVILRVVALHTEHHAQSHAGTEVRVLAVGFLSTSPAWVAEDVHVRCPYREAAHLHVLAAQVVHTVVVLDT